MHSCIVGERTPQEQKTEETQPNRLSSSDYLHGDHLGSTSLSTDSSGQEVTGSRTLYYPYGEERWSASGGTLTTDYGFTGQRRERGIGLYDYNARFYDPALGRFVSADTIVPSPGNPQDLNRYAYVNNNPCRYTDPSGHCGADNTGNENLDDSLHRRCVATRDGVEADYGFDITGQWMLAEMEYMVDILKGFETLLGLDRFISLVQIAVQAHDPAGVNQTLTIRRDRGTNSHPIAGWQPSVGTIYLNDGIFDGTAVTSYRWPVLGTNPNTIQNWVFSHEVGHVTLDGLRAEHGRDYWYIEATYDHMVPQADVFHPAPNLHPNESVASELANMAALQVSRPDPVNTWANTIAIPALQEQSITEWEQGR